MIDFVIDPGKYRPASYPQICILNTDLVEPELLIRRLAQETAEQFADEFQGETPQVFYRMRYVPPYENFEEIRKMILQIRSATGIRSSFKGILAVDISEYKGHEEEEYFSIFLKYLCDNSRGCKTILVCSQYTGRELEHLQNVCIRFFTWQQETMYFYQGELLEELLRRSFLKHRCKITPDAVKVLAGALQTDRLVPYRTLQLLDRIPMEVQSMGSKISRKELQEYLSNPCSSICMLAGQPLLPEKENSFEYSL